MEETFLKKIFSLLVDNLLKNVSSAVITVVISRSAIIKLRISTKFCSTARLTNRCFRCFFSLVNEFRCHYERIKSEIFEGGQGNESNPVVFLNPAYIAGGFI